MSISKIVNKVKVIQPGTSMYDSALKHSKAFQKQQIKYLQSLNTADIIGTEAPKITAGKSQVFGSIEELNAAAKKASSRISKDGFIKTAADNEFNAALARDCARIHAKEHPSAKQRGNSTHNSLSKEFIGNFKKAAKELLNSTATKLANIFKK